jgi:hypothetical protein
MCDSSVAYPRVLRPKPSPADLPFTPQPVGRVLEHPLKDLSVVTAPTGAPKVSRFPCRKFLGVHWGLRLRRTAPELALSLREHVAFRISPKTSAS